MIYISEDDAKELLEMKAEGIPLVIHCTNIDDGGGTMVANIYAAKPSRSRVPKVSWQKVWSSEPFPQYHRQLFTGKVQSIVNVPVKKVAHNSLVSVYADGSCKFAKACMDIAIKGDYARRYLPTAPSSCKRYPALLMKNETWAKKIKKAVEKRKS